MPDELAGREARCPACAAAVSVPSLGEARPATPGSEAGSAAGEASGSADGNFDATLSYQGSSSATAGHGWQAWTAGAPGNRAGWSDSAEPPVTPRTAIRPTRISVGDVFSRSWSIFVNNLGNVVGAGLVVYLLNSLCGVLIRAAQNGALRSGGNWAGDLGVMIITYVAGTAFTVWLTAGFFQYLLRIARGQPAHFGQLFEAGPLVVPATIATIVYSLIVTVGLVACVVPGIVLGLMYWMAVPLLIDTRMGVAEAFHLSKRVTDGNKWALAGVWLTSVGVAAVGALLFCVGLVFALPFVALLHAVTYLAMTGQPIALPGMAEAASK